LTFDFESKLNASNLSQVIYFDLRMKTFDRDDVVATTKKIVSNICFVEVGEKDELLASKILDSINVIDLSVEIEGAFNIKIPFVDINPQHFGSVEKLSNYVQIKLSTPVVQ
jgi:acyl carrier protein